MNDDDIIELEYGSVNTYDSERIRAQVAHVLEYPHQTSDPPRSVLHPSDAVTIADHWKSREPALAKLVDHEPGSRSAMIEAIGRLKSTSGSDDDFDALHALQIFVTKWGL